MKMKIKNKLMRRAFSAVVFVAIFAALGIVGCEESDAYKINAPLDLQDRIDSIAASKDRGDTGDTTYIDIITSNVGAEDFSSGWWSEFSDYFAVPSNELLNLEFINNSAGTDNYKNWVLVVSNEAGDRDAENYAEYFVLRSDAFGWGNGDYDGGLISHNFPDLDGDGDIWNDFRQISNGATVTLEIDHSVSGYAFVTATTVGLDGTEMVMTYNQPVSASADLNVFLVAEGCYLNMKEAYTIPSKITIVEDVNPASISVSGTPVALEQSDDLTIGDFWGDGVATVIYEDGSSAVVDTADVTFNVIPDMTELGEKTVVISYSKTKQGNYGPSVSTAYKVEVTNPVTSLEITTAPQTTTYAFWGTESPAFDPTGLVVTATYSDGTTGVLENSTLQYEIPLVAGAQDAVISYVGATSTVSTTVPVTVIEGIDQVGATDFSTGWWTEFSDDYNVPSGTNKTLRVYCYSDNAENYHSPCTILRKADATENAVVRMDNFGWGDGYNADGLTSDWNWDIFTSSINGSQIDITVTNHGDNTATIRYDVTYSSGEKHFQQYEGITVDSADLNCALVIEGAYVVIVE